MSTSKQQLQISGYEIDVIRKNIKNMHLAVYPPTGRLRLAAPKDTDDEVLRLFALTKLPWIKQQIKELSEQERETLREYLPGESHYFLGKRYLLEFENSARAKSVEIRGTKRLVMKVNPEASTEAKENLLKEWYRKELKKIIPPMLNNWEEKIGVKANDWGIKQMRTKWGSCNTDAKRIWLNLELAKKPKKCLEYILVHELIHLIERHHNENFVALMDQHMPRWRLHRKELNELPVKHEDWSY